MWYRMVALALAAITLTAPIAAVTAATTATAATITAASATPTVYIYNASAAAATGAAVSYAYLGCYLEVSGPNGTGGRTLVGSTAGEVWPGDMTASMCLAFCGGGASGSAYTYAGLEYARECWCGTEKSSLATKQPALDCNLPCDGDNTTLCGGSLRINLYKLSSASAQPRAAMALVVAALLLAL